MRNKSVQKVIITNLNMYVRDTYWTVEKNEKGRGGIRIGLL